MPRLNIAVDAMGGDDAPQMVIEGVARALKKSDAHFIVFGDEEKLRPYIEREPGLSEAITLVHTPDVITADDKPSQAVRRGRKSSMGLAIQAVKDGKAQVAVSAGNTGALMALSKILLRMVPGIDRPAIATPIPTKTGECLLLDLGANIECSAKNLVQFAVMGAAYARVVFEIDRPTLALLNVGVEELKGHEAVKTAGQVLKETEGLPMNFIGFTEGDGLSGGGIDVIVTDGFTGNVVLKATEGIARMIKHMLEDAFRSNWMSKLGFLLARKGMLVLRNELDPNNHNGGVFLGLGGLVVKSHGGANARGFASALGVAENMAKNDLNSLIMQDLKNFSNTEEENNSGVGTTTQENKK
ncbi:MAG: phosphate acyltransferase PlsX [Sphingomonadales bacterium]|nr:phosphate acyltransferase PlsX [Sphingomonadales bacterium]